MPRKRLVNTSRGTMEVELGEMRWTGFRVVVTVFKDDGWEESPSKGWASKDDRDETLAQFLASFARLPGPEATELATQLQGWRDEWWKSGGEEETRSFERWARWAVPSVPLVVLLAFLCVPLLVWLFVTQI